MPGWPVMLEEYAATRAHGAAADPSAARLRGGGTRVLPASRAAGAAASRSRRHWVGARLRSGTRPTGRRRLSQASRSRSSGTCSSSSRRRPRDGRGTAGRGRGSSSSGSRCSTGQACTRRPHRVAPAYLELAVLVRALEGLADAARLELAPDRSSLWAGLFDLQDTLLHSTVEDLRALAAWCLRPAPQPSRERCSSFVNDGSSRSRSGSARRAWLRASSVRPRGGVLLGELLVEPAVGDPGLGCPRGRLLEQRHPPRPRGRARGGLSRPLGAVSTCAGSCPSRPGRRAPARRRRAPGRDRRPRAYAHPRLLSSGPAQYAASGLDSASARPRAVCLEALTVRRCERRHVRRVGRR